MSISYFEYLSILCVVDNVLPAARTGKIDYHSVLECPFLCCSEPR